MTEPRLFFMAVPSPAWTQDVHALLARLGLDKRLRSALFAPSNWHQSFSERIFNPAHEDRAALLQVGADVSARMHACTLEYNRITSSGEKPGSIHWTLYPRGKPEAFIALSQILQDALRAAGHANIATGVTPHMTLSYCARELLDKITLDPQIAWTIDELRLAIGGGKPYQYEIIGRWPLLPEIDPPALQPALF